MTTPSRPPIGIDAPLVASNLASVPAGGMQSLEPPMRLTPALPPLILNCAIPVSPKFDTYKVDPSGLKTMAFGKANPLSAVAKTVGFETVPAAAVVVVSDDLVVLRTRHERASCHRGD